MFTIMNQNIFGARKDQKENRKRFRKEKQFQEKINKKIL